MAKTKLRKVRVTIPIHHSVTYILKIPAETRVENLLAAVEDKIYGDGFDASNWQFDPNFYEALWDNIKNAFRSEKLRPFIEIEPMN